MESIPTSKYLHQHTRLLILAFPLIVLLMIGSLAGLWWFLNQSTVSAAQVAQLNELELRISTLEKEVKESNRIN